MSDNHYVRSAEDLFEVYSNPAFYKKYPYPYQRGDEGPVEVGLLSGKRVICKWSWDHHQHIEAELTRKVISESLRIFSPRESWISKLFRRMFG